jgi:tetratricopeptide (TPR) repeat protein
MRPLFIILSLLVIAALTVYIKPNFFLGADALYRIGLNKMKQGDHGDYNDPTLIQKAAFYFEKAIQKGYDERDVYDKLSTCYHWLGDNKNAERIYSLGLKTYPQDVEFLFYRGNCRKEFKNHLGAFEDYNKVVSLDTASRYLKNAIYYRGTMSYILGDTSSAHNDWLKAQKITDYELRDYADYSQLWR